MFSNCCPEDCTPKPLYIANYGGHRPYLHHALPPPCTSVKLSNTDKINDPGAARILVHHNVFPDPEPEPDPFNGFDYFDPFCRIPHVLPKSINEPEQTCCVPNHPFNPCEIIKMVTDSNVPETGHPFSEVMSGAPPPCPPGTGCVNGKFPCNPRIPILQNDIYRGCEPTKCHYAGIPFWGRKLESNGCFYYNTYSKP